MSRIEEAEKLLSNMTKGEKAKLFQKIVQDLGDAFPGIDSTPGVCGGGPLCRPHSNLRLGPGTGPAAGRR